MLMRILYGCAHAHINVSAPVCARVYRSIDSEC